MFVTVFKHVCYCGKSAVTDFLVIGAEKPLRQHHIESLLTQQVAQLWVEEHFSDDDFSSL